MVGMYVKVVDVVDYESALMNFRNRLRAWDEAEEKVELLVEEPRLMVLQITRKRPKSSRTVLFLPVVEA